MRKFNFKLILAIMAAIPLMLITSCSTDDDGGGVTTNEFQPVLGENFDFTVNGNDVLLTTTISGNVWATVNDVDHTMVDKKVTVKLPNAGIYAFTVSSLGSGEILTSEPFEVEILQDDLSFLELPEWKNLTDGTSKSWVLDVEAKLHDGPLSFYLTSWDFVAGAYSNDDTWFWTPDPQWAWDNAMAEPGEEGYGVMTFDVTDGFKFYADKTKEDDEEGTFDLDYENRMLKITGASILRSYKPNAEVNVDPNCTGDDCEKKTVNGITGISDWSNYHIFALTDSVLRLAVLRDADVAGEGEIYLVYNFVEKDLYESIVPEEFTHEEAPETSITASDLVGTWKFADVPMGWIAYTKVGNQGTTIPARLYEKWDTRTQVVETLTSWGLEKVDSVFTAQDELTYVFNGDGTCTINGEANSYTVSNGIITFGSPLQETEFSMQTGWLSHTLTGTEVTVVDVNHYGDEKTYESYTPEGIWIGQKNDDKTEYKAFQLVKQ